MIKSNYSRDIFLPQLVIMTHTVSSVSSLTLSGPIRRRVFQTEPIVEENNDRTSRLFFWYHWLPASLLVWYEPKLYTICMWMLIKTFVRTEQLVEDSCYSELQSSSLVKWSPTHSWGLAYLFLNRHNSTPVLIKYIVSQPIIYVR